MCIDCRELLKAELNRNNCERQLAERMKNYRWILKRQEFHLVECLMMNESELFIHSHFIFQSLLKYLNQVKPSHVTCLSTCWKIKISTRIYLGVGCGDKVVWNQIKVRHQHISNSICIPLFCGLNEPGSDLLKTECSGPNKQIWLTIESLQRSLSLHISNVSLQSRTNSGLKGLLHNSLASKYHRLLFIIRTKLVKTHLNIFFKSFLSQLQNCTILIKCPTRNRFIKLMNIYQLFILTHCVMPSL